MLAIVPHGGMPVRPALRLVHVFPPSLVSCTWPSLVPAQMSPGLSRDSAMANTTPAYSTPMLSGVSPPEGPIRLLSFRVRSGLMTVQLRPPSVVWWIIWLPTYTLLWSWGEMVSGKFQTKRYLTSPAGQAIGASRHRVEEAPGNGPRAAAEPAVAGAHRGGAVLPVAVHEVGDPVVHRDVVHLRHRRLDPGPALAAVGGVSITPTRGWTRSQLLPRLVVMEIPPS